MQTPAGVRICIVARSAARMSLSLATRAPWLVETSSCIQVTIDSKMLSVSKGSISDVARTTIFTHVTHACRPLGFAQMSRF